MRGRKGKYNAEDDDDMQFLEKQILEEQDGLHMIEEESHSNNIDNLDTKREQSDEDTKLLNTQNDLKMKEALKTNNEQVKLEEDILKEQQPTVQLPSE